MACRGVFFALTCKQTDDLLALVTDNDRLNYVQEHIEAAWEQAHLYETDKAWDAIHRCLTDGSLSTTPAKSPVGKLILGGRQLHKDTQTYIINFIDRGELGQIAAELKTVTREWMKKRYWQLRNTTYPQELISDQDCEYTLDWFSGIPDFIGRANDEGRCVIFTVDQ